MVIDTSVIIEHFRAKDKSSTTLYKLDEANVNISVVTLYEFYIGSKTNIRFQDISSLSEQVTILSFGEETAIIAADIYRQLKADNKMIEFRDIFIAATCIENNLPIVTLNKKHFERIKRLNII